MGLFLARSFAWNLNLIFSNGCSTQLAVFATIPAKELIHGIILSEVILYVWYRNYYNNPLKQTYIQASFAPFYSISVSSWYIFSSRASRTLDFLFCKFFSFFLASFTFASFSGLLGGDYCFSRKVDPIGSLGMTVRAALFFRERDLEL